MFDYGFAEIHKKWIFYILAKNPCRAKAIVHCFGQF